MGLQFIAKTSQKGGERVLPVPEKAKGDLPQKVVVALLPCYRGKLLLQLRDQKEGIVFPGHWGFFSGALEAGETPLVAAKRELFEELGCMPRKLQKLGIRNVPEYNTVSHVYYFSLEVPPEKLLLREGMDLGLFSLEEIASTRLYSVKLQQWFPAVDNPMFTSTVRELFLEVLRKEGGNLV